MDGTTTYTLTATLNASGQPAGGTVINVSNLNAGYAITGSPGANGATGATGATGPQGIPGNPATNLVTSVATRIGDIVLTKTDVGLSNVDNTSDVNKPVSTAQATADALKLAIANNLSDLNSASTARTNLGLGTLATQSGTFSGTSSGTNTGDQTTISGNAGTATKLLTARAINGVSFDGSAPITVADSTKLPTAGGTMSGAIAMGANKVTGLANGTVSTDAAAFGQIPTALPPNGTAAGDLTGTYPNPTLGVSGVTAATYGDATHVNQVTYDAKGRATSASSVAIAIPESAVTNLTTDLAAKQATLSLTTTGSSGAATLVGATLNVPQYTGGGGGDMLLASTQTNTGSKTFNAGTLLDKGEIVFDVKAFGAVGNDSTDDTTAIQNAINAANTAGGGIVWFPKGTYKITAALKLYSGTTPTIVAYTNITLAGSGASGTSGSIIKQYTTGLDCIKGLNDIANGAQILNITVQDLCVLWGTATKTNSGNGIYLAQQAAGGPSFQQINMKNVVASGFQGSGKYGFNIESIIGSTLNTCMAVSCANGFYLNGAVGSAYGSVSTSTTLINCYANMSTNGVNGYNILDNTYVTFIGCACDVATSSTGSAYLVDGSNSISFYGCGNELNGVATLSQGWKITNGSSQIGIHNPYIYQSKTMIDVYVTGSSTGVTIIGAQDNSSISGSTGLKVDAGSSVSEIDNSWGAVATLRTIAGIDMILSDTAGGAQIKSLALTTALPVTSGGTGATTSTGSGAVVLGTTPTLATPVINGLSTGTGVASAATASTLATRDVNANLTANSFIDGYATTVTAAGTTTLTVGSAQNQAFTGSTTQIVLLPVASTLVLGQQFWFRNNSTNAVTVQSSGANTIVIMSPNTSALLTCILTSGTGTASWDFSYIGTALSSGTMLKVNSSLTIAGSNGATMTFPSTSGTVATLNATQTFTNVQTFTSSPVLSSGAVTVSGSTVTLPTTVDTLVGRATTDTFTNKRNTLRTNSTASSATPAINTDTTDEFDITALAVNITSMTTSLTGTPNNGDELTIRFKDNGTARTIAWGTSFVSSGVATLLATTVISKTHFVKLRWDSTATKWVCLAVDAVGY